MIGKKRRNIVFMIDNNKMFSFTLCLKLSSQNKAEVICYSSLDSVLDNINLEPVIIVLDSKFLENEGLRKLVLIKKKLSNTKIVILAEEENQSVFIDVGIKLDYTYLIKEKDQAKMVDKLIQTIYNFIETRFYRLIKIKQLAILMFLLIVTALISFNIFVA